MESLTKSAMMNDLLEYVFSATVPESAPNQPRASYSSATARPLNQIGSEKEKERCEDVGQGSGPMSHARLVNARNLIRNALERRKKRSSDSPRYAKRQIAKITSRHGETRTNPPDPPDDYPGLARTKDLSVENVRLIRSMDHVDEIDIELSRLALKVDEKREGTWQEESGEMTETCRVESPRW